MPTIAENIRHHRKRRKLTQLALARKMGLQGEVDGSAFVCRVENGKQVPLVETLHRFAVALEVNVEKLLKGTK